VAPVTNPSSIRTRSNKEIYAQLIDDAVKWSHFVDGSSRAKKYVVTKILKLPQRLKTIG
jgi:hypothetical protein